MKMFQKDIEPRKYLYDPVNVIQNRRIVFPKRLDPERLGTRSFTETFHKPVPMGKFVPALRIRKHIGASFITVLPLPFERLI